MNRGRLTELLSGFVKGSYILASKAVKSLIDEMDDKRSIESGLSLYEDAMNEILVSDMFPSSKKEALALLKLNAPSNYYTQIIKIVNMDDFDSKKIEYIKIYNKTIE